MVTGLDADRLDDDLLVAVVDEPELGFVGGLEGAASTVDRSVGEIDGDRGVGAVVAQMKERSPGDDLLRNVLAEQFRLRVIGQPFDQVVDGSALIA